MNAPSSPHGFGSLDGETRARHLRNELGILERQVREIVKASLLEKAARAELAMFTLQRLLAAVVENQIALEGQLQKVLNANSRHG